MATIYQTATGDSVYDFNGQTMNAKTGQVYTPPATATPAAPAAPAAPTTVVKPPTSSPSAPTMYTPPTPQANAAPPLPTNLYASVRGGITSGTMTPQQAQQYLQSYISSGQYSGAVDTNQLFSGLTIVKSGVSYTVNPDGTMKQLSGTVNNNVVGGYGTNSTSSTAVDPNARSGAAPLAPTAENAAANHAQPLQTNLPGGNATTLNDYFAAKGTALPTVEARKSTFEQLGLGKAAEYTGTAQQNEEMLSALQLRDHSSTTMGQPGTPYTPKTDPVNSTPGGISLASALSGTDAATTLANYQTYLSSALGAASTKLSTDEASLNSFFSSEQDPGTILQDAYDSAGVTTQQGILADLDKEIQSQQKTLDALPEAIRTSLSDAGVSQAQLTRLTAKETDAPTKALNNLLSNRNATSSEIDKAMTFAKQFADTKIAAQAAKLSALEWQVTSDRSDYNNLDSDAKAIITNAINDQKDIMTTALTAAKNGASADVVDAILNSGSASAAIQVAGPALVTPKKTAGTSSMTTDISSAAGAFSSGVPSKGYNGVGPDGYIDPNLYVQLYNAAVGSYGQAGGQAFIKAYPPTGGGKFAKGIKGINPANIGTGLLPSTLQNLLLAGQKTTTSKIQ